MSKPNHVLFCHCAYRNIIPDQVKKTVLGALAGADVQLTAVPDLCEMVVRRPESLRRMAAAGGLRVVACHPRALKWLLYAAGVDPAATRVVFADMRSETPEVIVRRVAGAAAVVKDAPETDRATLPETGDWVPWFPVIDYDRCRNCKQCLSFCPFGVYEADAEGRVRVAHPANCKDNCPACARICPELAIVFPKITETPVDGSEINEADLRRHGERAVEQIRRLSGGKDIHALLAQRRARALSRNAAAGGPE